MRICCLLAALLSCAGGVQAQSGGLPALREYTLEELPSLTSPSASPAPSPAATPTAAPASAATPAASPAPSPTPLPDGTAPASLPAMPAPALEDAATLSEQLNVPVPAPPQAPEPLRPPTEAEKLKESQQLAMRQKMVMADFEKSLAALIAKQKNPNVPDLTIDGAVQTALKLNPDILNAIQQIRLTRGQLIQVAAQAIPQITISSGYQQNASSLNPNNQRRGPTLLTIPNPAGGPPTVLELSSPQPEEQNQTWNIQFQGSQLIFDGGATVSGIRAGEAAYDSAFFSLRATIDAVVAQVISQFYQVVLNRALIVAQQQNVALLEQQVKDQQDRFEAGTVPRFNVLQAEVALANAKPPLIQAENAYRISLYQLVKLLGMDSPAGRPAEVPFNVVGTLGYSPREVDTDASIRVAIARNPSLKAQRQAILAQAANVNAQVGGFFPRINATAGWQFQNDTTSSDLSDNLSGWFFGATGTWNFWDGGQTYGQVAQAKAQLMQAKNTYEDGVRGIVLSVQEAISNLQQARETIDSQTASVVQATEALRLARERLDAGAGTQLDVLNAQVQLLQAQTNVLQARYNYLAAMASYDQALSLDTQYVELFDDPLIRPLNPQALSKAETRRFNRVTAPDRPQVPLPRKFRKDDPVKPFAEAKTGATPAPAPTPKKKPSSKK
ncbi:MAG: TolC family protein [Terrimicrobiaceae bacterium]|nr:TolC family protein [Terrimicrobiaceae bacterium]